MPSRVESVRIGSLMYKVRRKRRLPKDPDGSEVMGLYDPANGQILIKSHMPKDMENQTLWHEIVHGILDVAGQPSVVPDAVVDTIAHGVAQVLKDNPILRGCNGQGIPVETEPTV